MVMSTMRMADATPMMTLEARFGVGDKRCMCVVSASKRSCSVEVDARLR